MGKQNDKRTNDDPQINAERTGLPLRQTEHIDGHL